MWYTICHDGEENLEKGLEWTILGFVSDDTPAQAIWSPATSGGGVVLGEYDSPADAAATLIKHHRHLQQVGSWVQGEEYVQ
jgi:hypothetical protein